MRAGLGRAGLGRASSGRLDGMSQQGQRAGAAGAIRRRAAAAGWRPGRLARTPGRLVLVAVALRGNRPAPALDGPFRRDGLAVGAVLEGVLACLLVVLI